MHLVVSVCQFLGPNNPVSSHEALVSLWHHSHQLCDLSTQLQAIMNNHESYWIRQKAASQQDLTVMLLRNVFAYGQTLIWAVRVT